MPEVRILMRQEYIDYSRAPKGEPRIMVLFSLADGRQGVVSIPSADAKTPREDQAIRDEIARMGRPVGEYRVV